MKKVITFLFLMIAVFGSQGVKAQTATIDVVPTDDTFKRINSTVPEGDNTLLRNRRATNDYRFDVYVKYDISALQGKDVQQALVRFYTETAETTDGVTFELRRTAANWDETTMVHANRPDEIAVLTEIFYNGTPGWYEWDVTALVIQLLSEEVTELSVLSFPMSGSDTGTNVYWHSKENGSGNAPFLTVEYIEENPDLPKAADILVDDSTLDGFDPDVLNYSIDLPYYQTDIPVVTAIAADPEEEVTVIQATSLDGESAERTASVFIGSQDNQSVYTVVFQLEEQPKASDITVDGTTIDGFNQDVTEYLVFLPYNALDIPVVAATVSIEGATLNVIQATSLTGTEQERTAQVLVGEPGYEVAYSVTFQLEDPMVAAGIYVDGILISGFEPMVMNYGIQVPYFVDEIPVVTADAADPEINVQIIQATSLTGEEADRTAYVTIGEGENQFEYTILFEVVNSFSFSPTDDTYTRPGNEDINGDDIILYNRRSSGEWRRDVYMKFDLSNLVGLNAGSAKLKVYTDFEIPDVTEVFELRHTETNWDETMLHGNNRPATIAGLTEIIYNGTPGWYEWDITELINNLISEGQTEVSLLSFPMSDSDGNRIDWHSKENPSGMGPALTITNLDHLKASDISINGETIDGFDQDVRNYTISLPYYTIDIPQIEGDAINPEATVSIEHATSLLGTDEERTTRVIISDDNNQFVYSVIFELEEQPKASDIRIDGVTVEGFDQNLFNYEVDLPYYETVIPVISADATLPEANVMVTQATSLTDTIEERTASVMIGETGHELVYSVIFELEEQPKAAEIMVDGTLIEGFDQDVLDYEIILSYGTTDVPVISAQSNITEATIQIMQAVALTGEAADRTATIMIGEPGFELEYKVVFSLDEASDSEALENNQKIRCWYHNGDVFIENFSTRARFDLYSINGQQIKSGYVGNGQKVIHTEGLTSGIYFLSLDGIDKVFKLFVR